MAETTKDRRLLHLVEPQQTRHMALALAHDGPPNIPPSPPGMPLSGNGGQVQADEPFVLSVGRLNWPQILGGYAGALVLGGLVGFAAGGKRGVYTGAAATSFLWSTGETIKMWRARSWWVSLGFLALAAPSAWVVYDRMERR